MQRLHWPLLALAACLSASLTLEATRPTQTSDRSGSAVMSPSVIGSSVITREGNGPGRLELLIMWRGSPGWFMRRTGLGGGSSMGGGSTDANGSRTFTLHQGGLHLTATYHAATRVVRILDEDVPLKDANVIFVDDVDGPAGPRVIKTLAVATPLGPSNVLHPVFLGTPALLDYLRCGAHLPDPQNRSPINYVCSSAVALGLIPADHTVTPIPEGPVQNRAADLTGPDRPMRPTGPGFSSGDRVLSPAVVGAWFAQRDATGSTSLDLLVLWRGTPGWQLRGDGHSGASGGGSATGRRGKSVTYGGVTLHALFDEPARTAEIMGTRVPLGDHNVILVDDVDSPGGPKVVKTLRVDPELANPVRIEVAIRRSPELVAYLRCDVKLPDARQQAMMDLICSQVIGR